jgi:hypothetical protein
MLDHGKAMTSEQSLDDVRALICLRQNQNPHHGKAMTSEQCSDHGFVTMTCLASYFPFY